MKTIKLFFISVLFTVTANSQITKTNWLVGGSANFGKTKSETITNTDVITETEFTYIEVEPNIGYFLMDKFAVGITTGINANFIKKNTYFLYNAGPFVRYYWLKAENRVNFLTHVQYIFYGDNKNSSKTNEFNAKLGPVIYFNSSIGLEMTLSYSQYKNTFNDSSNSKQIVVGLNIGLQIHLDK